jgi:hypothetical protein
MQYTVRDIPKTLDRALRARAKQQGKSLNQVTLETLHEALGLDSGGPKEYTDLDWFLGTGKEDPELDAALQAMDRVCPDDWK